MTGLIGPAADLKVRWQLDDEWVVPTDHGFSHWWHGLEQVIRYAAPDSEGFIEWEARTFVVRDIKDADAALSICHELNRHTAGCAYLYDGESASIFAVASYFGMPEWDQRYAQWNVAARVSYWHADTIASTLAAGVAGVVDVSGPPDRGPRKVPDSLLNYVQYNRARPEWVCNPTMWSLPNPQKLSPALIEWIGSKAVVEDRSTHDYARLWCLDAAFIAEVTNAGTEPAFPPAKAQYEITGARSFREPFGEGFLARMRIPVAPDRAEQPAATANRLNHAMALTASVRGAFYVSEHNVFYEIFVPGFSLRTVQVGQSHPNGLQLSSGVVAGLSAALQFVDTVAPGGADVHDELPDAPLAREVLEVFAQPANEALAGAPSPDPERADRRYLWVQGTVDLCHFGIFNPSGPTLNSLQLAPRADGTYELLFLMRHPFGSKYRQLGHVATQDDLRTLLTSELPEELWSLPEFVWFVAPDELHDVTLGAMWDVFAALTENDANADTDLAWTAATLRHYEGRAWDRLNHVDDVPQPERPYAGVEGVDYQTPIGPSRDFEDWLYAAADIDNVMGTLLTFPSAWDGAINFQREHGGLGYFDLD